LRDRTKEGESEREREREIEITVDGGQTYLTGAKMKRPPES